MSRATNGAKMETQLDEEQAQPRVGAAAARRRRVSPEAGRGMEILGHAIEYLADEFSLECMNREVRVAPGINARILAIEMLKARSREVYFSCPEVPSTGERLRSMLHLQRV